MLRGVLHSNTRPGRFPPAAGLCAPLGDALAYAYYGERNVQRGGRLLRPRKEPALILTREGVPRLSLQAPTDKAFQRRVGLSLFNLKTNLPQPTNEIGRSRSQFVSYGHLPKSSVVTPSLGASN